MTTDGQLIERLQLKDKAALELIYEQYHLLLWKVCCQEFADQIVRERILTEVFQQLWQQPQQFSGNKRLVFYLIQCVKEKTLIIKANGTGCLIVKQSCS